MVPVVPATIETYYINPTAAISFASCVSLHCISKYINKPLDIDAWAGASGLERAAFQAEAQAARQKFLINSATPSQLKQEANYETQKNREEFQRAEADRQHQVSSQQQSGMFPPLPATHAETGETIDARWLRKTSTINFELFKKLCKRHGSAAVTSRLRGEN